MANRNTKIIEAARTDDNRRRDDHDPVKLGLLAATVGATIAMAVLVTILVLRMPH